ncbi:MAG: sulfite exporter TauE/SafE family protein, partial [Candidatus Atribacteria bacterium]|nr:sulfite exporter TauE/SafE family protein [Candidatus Atribacteria bacterium]
LAGSVAMSGPPVILFLTNLKITKDCFKINIVIYFIVIGFIAILSMYFSEIINIRVIRLFLYFFPAMVLGVYIGISLSNRVTESSFRFTTLVVIFISGVLAISSSLKGISN